MKLLNIETPVTRNFISQILLNVQNFTSIRLATQVMTKASSDLRQTIQGSFTVPVSKAPERAEAATDVKVHTVRKTKSKGKSSVTTG
jgi:hypothetical protein